MKEIIIIIRNSIQRFFYKTIFKKIFFLINPETIHHHAVLLGKILGSNPVTRKLTACFFNYRNPMLEQTICNIHFQNPVGLAADAFKKIALGASLVQLITGMIFEGPQLISEMNQGLVKILKLKGFRNISEAIGSAHHSRGRTIR